MGERETARLPKRRWGSLEAAAQALALGGEIILAGDVTVDASTVVPAVNGNLSIRGEGGALILAARLEFANIGAANTITLDNLTIQNGNAASVHIYGNYNNMYFGDNLTVEAVGNRYPLIVAGYRSPGTRTGAYKNADAVSYSENVRVYIGSGTWENFIGGNYREDAYAAIGMHTGNIEIEIAGGTFKAVGAKSGIAGSRNQNFVATSFMGMNYFDGELSVKISGGTFEGPVYAVARLGSAYGNTAFGGYTRTGDITIDITGGRFLWRGRSVLFRSQLRQPDCCAGIIR